ncbi:hypothetical protein U14_01415 [Candidatus Moduliflexus flocculans]|uniref:Ice-binding protein C-terminal domain-containing protein n=1 Tax=Candidatus Moduliflexus flocculans TaxID=1499966 RepID=A0A0S6VWH5_9BACT|nr:hypothetical protein U14_01415 [Candidatus Moduliflexus flocculans]
MVNGPPYEHEGRHRLPGNGAWQQLSVTITFAHQEQMQIYLYGGTDTVYDDVQIAPVTPAAFAMSNVKMAFKQDVAPESAPTPHPVPEPGTLLLVAAGLIGVFALLRR